MTKTFLSLGKKLENAKKFFKNKKDITSYKTASSMIIKIIDKMCKLKPHNENLKIFADQIKYAIEKKDKEGYEKWLKAFRNEYMFDAGTPIDEE